MSTDPADLSPLRDRLRAIDSEILGLVAERLQIAREIGQRKAATGVGTRDYGQEKRVLERAVAEAGEHGISRELAEGLMLQLIEASLAAQEQDRVAHGGTGDGQRVLIIGGAGKMGRWFVRFLSSQGYAVEVADPADIVEGHVSHRDWKAVGLDHDVIIVAAPLRESAEILYEMSAVPPPGLIFDIGSLKSPLRDGLSSLARAGARVTSVHPMFGPDTDLLSHRHVIFVDLGVPEATAAARQLFASTMAIQVEMDLESHDRLIAYVLGLSHAANIAFATALAESGEAAPKLAQLSSTTFDQQLRVASLVVQENPHLYYEIQSLNDYGTEALAALLYAVERVRSVVRAGDEEAFVELMRGGREYLSGRPRL